jgi:hypothetical protein
MELPRSMERGSRSALPPIWSVGGRIDVAASNNIDAFLGMVSRISAMEIIAPFGLS